MVCKNENSVLTKKQRDRAFKKLEAVAKNLDLNVFFDRDNLIVSVPNTTTPEDKCKVRDFWSIVFSDCRDVALEIKFFEFYFLKDTRPVSKRVSDFFLLEAPGNEVRICLLNPEEFYRLIHIKDESIIFRRSSKKNLPTLYKAFIPKEKIETVKFEEVNHPLA